MWTHEQSEIVRETGVFNTVIGYCIVAGELPGIYCLCREDR